MNAAIRHYEVDFGEYGSITLPAEAWLNQTLVRELIREATGNAPPEFSDDDWLDLVFRIVEIAEEVPTR